MNFELGTLNFMISNKSLEWQHIIKFKVQISKFKVSKVQSSNLKVQSERVIIKFKVQISKFKVKKVQISKFKVN